MEAVSIHEAKTHFSRLVARAEAGEEIVIARGGTPVAKLVPLAPPEPAPQPLRKPGRLKGLVELGDEALEPWPEEWLREWEEGPPSDPMNWPAGGGGEPKR
jgi:prevent-host-death family protein